MREKKEWRMVSMWVDSCARHQGWSSAASVVSVSGESNEFSLAHAEFQGLLDN